MSAEDAIAGALDIIAENVSDDADCRAGLRKLFAKSGVISSRAAKEEDSVYSMYYEYSSLFQNPGAQNTCNKPRRKRGVFKGFR